MLATQLWIFGMASDIRWALKFSVKGITYEEPRNDADSTLA
jgi:hypothetical protein